MSNEAVKAKTSTYLTYHPVISAEKDKLQSSAAHRTGHRLAVHHRRFPQTQRGECVSSNIFLQREFFAHFLRESRKLRNVIFVHTIRFPYQHIPNEVISCAFICISHLRTMFSKAQISAFQVHKKQCRSRVHRALSEAPVDCNNGCSVVSMLRVRALGAEWSAVSDCTASNKHMWRRWPRRRRRRMDRVSGRQRSQRSALHCLLLSQHCIASAGPRVREQNQAREPRFTLDASCVAEPGLVNVSCVASRPYHSGCFLCGVSALVNRRDIVSCDAPCFDLWDIVWRIHYETGFRRRSVRSVVQEHRSRRNQSETGLGL